MGKVLQLISFDLSAKFICHLPVIPVFIVNFDADVVVLGINQFPNLFLIGVSILNSNLC